MNPELHHGPRRFARYAPPTLPGNPRAGDRAGADRRLDRLGSMAAPRTARERGGRTARRHGAPVVGAGDRGGGLRSGAAVGPPHGGRPGVGAAAAAERLHAGAGRRRGVAPRVWQQPATGAGAEQPVAEQGGPGGTLAGRRPRRTVPRDLFDAWDRAGSGALRRGGSRLIQWLAGRRAGADGERQRPHAARHGTRAGPRAGDPRARGGVDRRARAGSGGRHRLAEWPRACRPVGSSRIRRAAGRGGSGTGPPHRA